MEISNMLSEKIDSFMDHFSEYNLDVYTKKEIGNLYKIVYYRTQNAGPAASFPANYLLVTEYEEYAVSFVKKIFQVFSEEGMLKNGMSKTEEELCKDVRRDRVPQFVDFLLIRDCKADEGKGDITDSSQEIHEMYRQLPDILKERNHCITFAIVTPAVLESTWRKDTQRFYRTFSHHITLPDKTADQIYEMTLQKLEETGFAHTEKFDQAMKGYIDVVYPKAELKQEAFVLDFVNRIITRYYTKDTILYTQNEKAMLTEADIPPKHMPKTYEDTIAALQEDLVGAEQIVEQFRKIYYMYRYRPVGSKLRMHMIFSGAPGTGKTTVAKRMAEMFYAMGALKSAKLTVVKHEDLVGQYAGQTLDKVGKVIQESLDGVLFIDEAYALANTGHLLNGSQSYEQQAVNVLIQAMEKYYDRLVVIFAGYKSAMDQLEDSNQGIRSRIGHRIEFPSYTDEQLYAIFRKLCADNHISLQDEAAENMVKDRIRLEKSKKDFGNARAIENIFNEIFAAVNEKNPGCTTITAEDVQMYMPKKDQHGLENLVGLEEIKKRIGNYEKQAEYYLALRRRGCMVENNSRHMIFYGNPGTGKTTVARILANDLYSAGVLANNNCISIGVKDLAAFCGSGKKLEEFLVNARGGILFIDEAYALQNMTGFKEFVATLLTEMEEHPETILIFAGYETEMRAFLQSNPGLSSRISESFFFPDYTLEQLVEIYRTTMEKYELCVDGQALACVKELIRQFMGMEHFGNARFIRRLVDKTIENKAVSSYTDEDMMLIAKEHVPSTSQVKNMMI